MKMPPKRRREMSVPTASMGDIAFLLTIFFMICSNFAKEAGITLAPPRSVDVETVKESRTSVSVDSVGKIFLQGKQVPDAQAVEYGVAALLQNRKGDQARLVMFKCDKGVEKQVFEPVLDAISKAGGVIVAVGDKGSAAPQKQ